MGGSKGSVTAVMVAVLVALTAVTVAGQSGSSAGLGCVANLVGCAQFLNATTKPPQTCCGPLETAVKTQKKCLCYIYNNPAVLKDLPVNITKAMNLPVLCGIASVSPANFCKGIAMAPSPSSSPTPSGGGSSGTGGGSGKNAASTVSGFGLLSSLIMFVAYIVFY